MASAENFWTGSVPSSLVIFRVMIQVAKFEWTCDKWHSTEINVRSNLVYLFCQWYSDTGHTFVCLLGFKGASTTKIIHHSKLFANDTKLYCRVPDNSVSLQTDIDALVSWSAKWLIPFNASKSKMMHIGPNNIKQICSLDGMPVAIMSEERAWHCKWLSTQTSHHQMI